MDLLFGGSLSGFGMSVMLASLNGLGSVAFYFMEQFKEVWY
jgi:hypothetical protein